MPFIDPIQAFNVWNLSVMCAQASPEQTSFDNSALRNKGDLINEQSQIIKSDLNCAHYIRDGARCYVTATLRKEMFITDGMLYKEPKVKMLVKSNFYQIFLLIDFKIQ